MKRSGKIVCVVSSIDVFRNLSNGTNTLIESGIITCRRYFSIDEVVATSGSGNCQICQNVLAFLPS